MPELFFPLQRNVCPSPFVHYIGGDGLKRYALIFLSLAVAAAWGWNGWYYASQTLDEPIFLKHYYEVPEDALGMISFYYITNSDSDEEVFEIHVPGKFRMYTEHRTTEMRHGRFQLKQVRLAVREHHLEALAETPFAFDTIEVETNRGRRTVGIGEIVVHPARADQPGALQPHMSSGSSDGSGSIGYVAEEAVAVRDVEASFDEMLGDALQTELRYDKPASNDGKLEKGEGVKLDYRFTWRDGDPRRLHAYYLQFGIAVEKADGTLQTERHYAGPSLRIDPKDMARYAKERRKEASR
jgi:hypothetical protein